MPRSSEWPLPFRFSIQNFVCNSHLSQACYYSVFRNNSGDTCITYNNSFKPSVIHELVKQQWVFQGQVCCLFHIAYHKQ
jgi:hypothetical protein